MDGKTLLMATVLTTGGFGAAWIAKGLPTPQAQALTGVCLYFSESGTEWNATANPTVGEPSIDAQLKGTYLHGRLSGLTLKPYADKLSKADVSAFCVWPKDGQSDAEFVRAREEKREQVKLSGVDLNRFEPVLANYNRQLKGVP